MTVIHQIGPDVMQLKGMPNLAGTMGSKRCACESKHKTASQALKNHTRRHPLASMRERCGAPLPDQNGTASMRTTSSPVVVGARPQQTITRPATARSIPTSARAGRRFDDRLQAHVPLC